MFTQKQVWKFFAALLALALALPLMGQEDMKMKKDKDYRKVDGPYIKVTEKGTEYELVGWNNEVIYNPYTFTYLEWKMPVYEKQAKQVSYLVPVAEMDRPPVFDGYCLTQAEKIDCTNEQLQDYVKEHLEYPDEALNQEENGLVYVTFTLNEEGELENKLQVTSDENTCPGCADAAADLVRNMMDKWFPAIKDGEPVKVQLTLPFHFKIAETY